MTQEVRAPQGAGDHRTAPEHPIDDVLPGEARVLEAAQESLAGRRRGVRGAWPFLGPAFIAAVAYIDPGNFATNMAAGATFGYLLLWVVVAANLIAMLVQSMSAKLGIATRMNLAEVCRARFSRNVSRGLWVQAEVIAMATDVAEFIGAAIGLNLLFGIPLFPAALLTGVAAFLILGMQARGFRRLEAVIVAFIGVIVAAFAFQVVLAEPSPSALAGGLIPGFDGTESVLLAVGILGATVMPHVIYLHSALTQHRVVGVSDEEKRRIFHFELVDVVVAMSIAGLINMSMLAIAASVFYGQGLETVGDDLTEVYDGARHVPRRARERALRRRPPRLGALVVERRDAGGPGRHAGLHRPPDSALPPARRHDDPGARDRRRRRRPVASARAQPGRPLLRDPLRVDPAPDLLPRQTPDGLARQPPCDDAGGRRRERAHHRAQRLPARGHLRRHLTAR